MAMAGVQDKQMRIPTNWLDADKCRTGDDFAHWQLDTSNSTLCLPDVVAAAAGSVVQSSPMERRPPLLSTRTMNWKCVLNCSSMFTFRVKCSRGENTGHDRPSVCLCVCLSVPRRICTLLHGPECNLGEWGVPSSCALLGEFAIGARVSLLRQHSAERDMSASVCTLSMPGFIVCQHITRAV